MKVTLWHQPTGYFVSEVSAEEIRTLLKILPPQLHNEWFIRKNEGLTPLSAEFTGNAPPQMISEDTVKLDMMEDRSDQRKQTRFKRFIDFQAKHLNQVFQSETQDLNLQGLRLRDALPDDFPVQFQAALMIDDKAINVVVKRVKDPENLKLQIVDNANPELLKRWILR